MNSQQDLCQDQRCPCRQERPRKSSLKSLLLFLVPNHAHIQAIPHAGLIGRSASFFNIRYFCIADTNHHNYDYIGVVLFLESTRPGNEAIAPSPVLQQTNPAHFPRNERLVLLSNKKPKLEFAGNKPSKRFSPIIYTTLQQSERKKPKLESQHFPTSSSSPMQPCANKHSTLPKKRAAPILKQSQKKKLELLSSMLLD